MGGGESTSTQTQTKKYPAQAAPIFSREFSLLTGLLDPLQRQKLMEYTTQMFGGPGGTPLAGPTRAAALALPAAGTGMPDNLPLQPFQLAYQSKLPFELAQVLQGLLPQQYAGFFAPDTETTQTSEGSDQTGQAVFQTALAAPLLLASFL